MNARFVVGWTVATGVAIPLAQLTVDILFYALLGWLLLLAVPLLGGVVGLAVGTAQALVLRRHGLAGGGAWIAATTVGFAVAGLLALTTLGPATPPLARVAILGAPGAVIGLAQWPVARRWTARARWWVAASVVGWTGFAAVLVLWPGALAPLSDGARRLVDRAAGYATSGGIVGPTLLGGLLAGAITGVAADALRRRS